MEEHIDGMKNNWPHFKCKADLDIPSEWEDFSYGNDEMARIVHRETRFNLWIDYPKRKDKYYPNEPRFFLYKGLNIQDSFEHWVELTDMEIDYDALLIKTDNFQDVLDYIKTNEKK